MAERACPAVAVRAVSGGREWHVPDGDGGLTALAAKRYLATHGGFFPPLELFLLAGTRALVNHEKVRTALAETNEEQLTLVVCEPSWLADGRAILAGHWLRAVFAGTLPPGPAQYDDDAPLGQDDVQMLLQSAYALGERCGIAVQEASAKDFMLVLGSQMDVLQEVFECHLPGCELALARCAVLWALACSAPFAESFSFPLILPGRREDSLFTQLTLLRPRGCDLGECLGPAPRLRDVALMDLEDVSWACLIRKVRGFAGEQDEILEPRTSLAALRLRARLEAHLPVVLLGSFLEHEDVDFCADAGRLLFRQVAGPVLDELKVSGLPADYRLPEDDSGPVTLLRARGEVQDVARLAQLAADAGCWAPRLVWSVSTRGTTLDQVLSLLPQGLGEAAVIAL